MLLPCLIVFSSSVLGQYAASHISKFETCHCVSKQRVQGVYQSEGCIKTCLLSDALLFSLVLHFSSSLCVCLNSSGWH